MAELAPLSILITADADDLQAEISRAKTAISGFEKQAAKSGKGAKAMGGALGALGNVSNSTRAKIQLASFQLQDIAVQMQAGTKTSVVMAQQLPQLAGAFGAVGAAVGVLAAVGIPALSFAFEGLSGKAYDFDDALEAIEDTIANMKDPMNILTMSVEELRDKYGEAADAVLRFATFQAQARAAQAGEALRDQIGMLDSVIKRYADSTVNARAYSKVIERIRDEFGLSRDAAHEFGAAMTALEDAATFEQQQAALQRILDLMEESNLSAAELPPELRRALDEMVSLSIATEEARALMAQLGAEARNVNIGSGWTFDPATDMPPVPTTPARPSRGGGGKREDPIVRELEQLQQSLLTQEEAQIASFERQQETLQSALEKRLLTQQEYAALMEDAQRQHSDKMAAIDAYRYGTTLDKTGQFLGDMASALQSGNDKMMKISQAFAAGEALVNAWRAYSQTLADPTLPWWARIPKAAAVLSAGIGAVNAIKSVGSGGSGASVASASSASAAGGAGTSSGTFYQVSIQGDTVGISSIEQLFDQINEGLKDGHNIRGLQLV